ncbi:MAG TPA: phosphoribosylformylglycinamidine synthase subunit PurS [Chitinophagales bacterium]|nr:phosphoribosylformylglycinamidine synthase subunit PurS [Chitinophagales bacterium]HLP49460.1 phosphoribosylformylglycinamidine synthase subunit PurS [Chitinophagales bacterium]
MNFRAEIDVMPLKELLDPQGKAVAHGLQKMNFDGIADVRIGKHITLKINAASKEEATTQVENACKKLLANPIMEGYKFELVQE